jgi:hypothetical protein
MAILVAVDHMEQPADLMKHAASITARVREAEKAAAKTHARPMARPARVQLPGIAALAYVPTMYAFREMEEAHVVALPKYAQPKADQQEEL